MLHKRSAVYDNILELQRSVSFINRYCLQPERKCCKISLQKESAYCRSKPQYPTTQNPKALTLVAYILTPFGKEPTLSGIESALPSNGASVLPTLPLVNPGVAAAALDGGGVAGGGASVDMGGVSLGLEGSVSLGVRGAAGGATSRRRRTKRYESLKARRFRE